MCLSAHLHLFYLMIEMVILLFFALKSNKWIQIGIDIVFILHSFWPQSQSLFTHKNSFIDFGRMQSKQTNYPMCFNEEIVDYVLLFFE